VTPEQYLKTEHAAEFRSEFRDGEMFLRAGSDRAHCGIVTNIIGELRQQFRGRPCQGFSSGMRVRVNAANYTYPDLVAVCGPQEFLDAEMDTLLNPGLVIEVLSRPTEAYGRGRKFELYMGIVSLREYLLIASDRVHADLYTRMDDGRWILTSADGLEASLSLESVGASLRLADVYEKVEFTAQSTPAV
jgi:Uma2 family endonuclease